MACSIQKKKKRPKNPASNLFNSINRNANQIASWSDFSHLKLVIVCSPNSVAFSPTIIVSRHTPLPTAGLSRLLSSNVISIKQHKPDYIGDIYWLCEQVLIKSAQKELCNMAYVVISLSDIFLTLSSTKYLSMLFAYLESRIFILVALLKKWFKKFGCLEVLVNHFMCLDLITVSYPFLYHTCGHSVSSGYTHPALHFDVLPLCYL